MATVLVADDERDIVALLIELVEDTGHTALSARNGVDALTLAQRHLPHLIISDVMMPVMDGYALAAAVHADPALTHTVIILVSAGFSEHALPTVPGARCLGKPLDLTILDAVLAALPQS